MIERAMMEWAQNLSSRERLMVGVGALVGLLYLIWQFVIVPIGGWQNATSERLRSSKLGYDQVILAARLHGGSSVKVRETNADLATPLNRALASSASQARLIVSSTDNSEGNSVQITLAPAEGEQIFAWIAAVRDQYGAIVTEARFGRARNNPTLIKTDRLIFTRPVATPGSTPGLAGTSQ